MSKLSTHISFFGKRYPITINDLLPGMIVEFTYRKTSLGKPETKRYTVMIVDPKFKRPQDREDFTHAVNLDAAPRAALLDIARRTGATMANSNLQARMVYADKLLVEGQPRQFYQNSISQLISSQGKGSYRTFKTLKIQGIQLIDYSFPKSIDYYDPSEISENEN
tara:strand:+ start:69 stop:563 length:495 start_codon:yes stop_codon:yes gene_type:complete